jgi:hypothetical protein
MIETSMLSSAVEYNKWRETIMVHLLLSPGQSRGQYPALTTLVSICGARKMIDVVPTLLDKVVNAIVNRFVGALSIYIFTALTFFCEVLVCLQ